MYAIIYVSGFIGGIFLTQSIDINNVKRIVLKVGSSTLTKEVIDESTKATIRVISKDKIDEIAETILDLKERNIEVLLVTSAAIAAGKSCVVKNKTNLEDIVKKQVSASVGQHKLLTKYEKALKNAYIKRYGLEKAGQIEVSQILVNKYDFKGRNLVNLLNNIEGTLNCGFVPIINENDAVAIDEIKVGDNDTLSALIAKIVEADALILFSDIDGLYDKDPNKHKDARLIDIVQRISEVRQLAGDAGSDVGTGGMKTKLDAAEICTSVGIDVIIANGNNIRGNIEKLLNGKVPGTLFVKKEPNLQKKYCINYLLYKLKKNILEHCSIYKSR